MAYPGHYRDATFVLNLAPQRIIVFVIHHGTHGARCLSNGGNSSARPAWSASTGAIRGRPSEGWRADDGDVTISRSRCRDLRRDEVYSGPGGGVE